jgi:hypothetical protein
VQKGWIQAISHRQEKTRALILLPTFYLGSQIGFIAYGGLPKDVLSLDPLMTFAALGMSLFIPLPYLLLLSWGTLAFSVTLVIRRWPIWNCLIAMTCCAVVTYIMEVAWRVS